MNTLPPEVWDLIIDTLPILPYANDFETRIALRACSLVCRRWLPRCRYHLIAHIKISSPDALHSATKILKSAPGWPEKVRQLDIDGGKSAKNQSWISSVPQALGLPKLPNLRRLVFRSGRGEPWPATRPTFFKLLLASFCTRFGVGAGCFFRKSSSARTHLRGFLSSLAKAFNCALRA